MRDSEAATNWDEGGLHSRSGDEGRREAAGTHGGPAAAMRRRREPEWLRSLVALVVSCVASSCMTNRVGGARIKERLIKDRLPN